MQTSEFKDKKLTIKKRKRIRARSIYFIRLKKMVEKCITFFKGVILIGYIITRTFNCIANF